MTMKPLDYASPRRTPALVFIGAAVFLGACLSILAWSTRAPESKPRTADARVLALDSYQRRSDAILADPRLTDSARAAELFKLVSSARAQNVLPLATGWPSEAEIELAIAFSAGPDSVEGSDEASAAEFREYARKAYPAFHADAERERRDWLRRHGTGAGKRDATTRK
jgi:hypothetical protein